MGLYQRVTVGSLTVYQPYRNAVTTADGTTKPALTSALWAANPGSFATCTVIVTATGAPTSCTLRPYLRAGGATGIAATAGAAQTLGGAPNYDLVFTLPANGMDVAVLVETLSGGTSPAVTIALVWS